jgi:hypothetical protein
MHICSPVYYRAGPRWQAVPVELPVGLELVSRHTVTRRSLRRGRLGADIDSRDDRHRRSPRHRRSRQPTVSGKYKYKHNAWSAMLFPRVSLCAEQGVSAAAWPCRLQALPRRRTPSGGGTADGSPNCCAPGMTCISDGCRAAGLHAASAGLLRCSARRRITGPAAQIVCGPQPDNRRPGAVAATPCGDHGWAANVRPAAVRPAAVRPCGRTDALPCGCAARRPC